VLKCRGGETSAANAKRSAEKGFERVADTAGGGDGAATVDGDEDGDGAKEGKPESLVEEGDRRCRSKSPLVEAESLMEITTSGLFEGGMGAVRD
jgi:hypothetical protein